MSSELQAMHLVDVIRPLKAGGDLWVGSLFTCLNPEVKLAFRNSMQFSTPGMEA